MPYTMHNWKQAGQTFQHQTNNIFYRIGGQGETILAIHGYPISSWDWHQIWDPLTSHFKIIAPDLLGFGFSDKPLKYTYSVWEHANMIIALLQSLNLFEVHVLAHDLGVSVAQELLARSEKGRLPIKIQSICFLNGGLFAEAYKPRLMQKILSSALGGFIGPLIPKAVFKRVIRELFGPKTQPTEEELENFWSIVKFNDGLAVTHLVGRFVLERQRYRDDWVLPMQRTRIPMTFIDGPYDPNSGAHMVKRYVELIPRPSVVTLPAEIGHWPQLEAPALAAEHISKFIRNLPKAMSILQ